MAKIADNYFLTDPFRIIEDGFDPDYSEVTESVFSLGNEYMGVRGFFEEGYSGNSLMGNYFNGIYESNEVGGSEYKGIIKETEFMVNALNWLYTRISLDGQELDLHMSKFRDFKRILDMRTGILVRSFVWITEEGKEVRLEFERLLSMDDPHFGLQEIAFTPLNFSGQVKVIMGADFTPKHNMVGKNLWDCETPVIDERYISILGTTKNTKQSIFSCSQFFGDITNEKDMIEEKMALKEFTIPLSLNKTSRIRRVTKNIVNKAISEDNHVEFNVKVNEILFDKQRFDYDLIKTSSLAWWDKIWKESDIIILGDELNQQGIRYCIFQMHQTYHGTEKGTNIGAKGLTGEAYSGNAFWDTETYCLPFYIFNNVDAAKNLLEFRYMTLGKAMERAKDLDCDGAFYPIATISGKECCSLWQHASLQLQASTAVAYGIWAYEKITGDAEFLFEKGIPMLVEISRMLVTRGDWNQNHTRYGYYGVMGPDEFQMMVNHNCYTNYMGKVTLEMTLEAIERLKRINVEFYNLTMDRLQIKEEELRNWANVANHMYIPYDEKNHLFEQHEGYFSLPHIDVDKISIEEFPLYNHWSYDRIYRNDMIKQPDVLMLMLLFNSRFTNEQIKKNYEYYEPRCIHESSLSPSVHSILASQLQKHEEAYRYFGFATRMDLDNYNRNTNQGLHTTSIAAAWMNIAYGFGGMRSDGELLSFNPSIPAKWEGYSFHISYKGDIILLNVGKEEVELYTMKGTEILVKVYDQEICLSKESIKLTIPKEWRG